MNSFDISAVEDGCNIFELSEDAIQWDTNTQRDIVVEKLPTSESMWVLHNVMSEEECDQFVFITELMGYSHALITTNRGMVRADDVRNNKRVLCNVDGNVLFQRIYDHIPQSINCYREEWKATGMNERFRFYRYHEHEVFNPHYDGCFPKSDTEETFMTFIVYLTDDFTGGETTFFARRGQIQYRVTPVKGSALIFFHGSHPESPLHEGSLCNGGTKYVLRSDIMYTKQ